MITIYDDVFYIETLKDMDENNKIHDEGQLEEKFDDNEEYCELFENINRKKMFEKLLKETLEELNKTNPALESSKYHMLCLQTRRYNRYISYSEHNILVFEIKIFKKNRKKHIENCFWCYWFKHERQTNDEINYKSPIDKKRD
jgi:hypothetical protein